MKISIRWSATAAVLAVVLGAQAALAQDPAKGEPEMIGSWSGSFRPGTMIGNISGATSGTLSGTGAAGRYTGSIDITPSESAMPGSYRFSLNISSNMNNPETLEWGISNGRCGSKLIMLVGSNSFPTIEMRSGGVGDVTSEVAMQFTSKGQFQAVLFKGGHMQQNIVACANLKFEERRK
ncbi:MAG: hypothetical protein ACYC3L_05710 [Gemmatimonadaceae bacterium]